MALLDEDPNRTSKGMEDAVLRLEQLYQDLGPDLMAYLSRRHDDERQAEDLLQDTFVEAMRHPDRLARSLSPRAYLFGIARNLSRRAYRKQRFLRLLAMSWTGETPAATGGDTTDPRLVVMREAIGALPDVQREVVEFRLQQELRYEEIAEVLGIPVGTVRSRLHNAVARLRQAIGDIE